MGEPIPDKHIPVTKKQVGVGSAILAAILILNPVKEWLFTREEGLAQTEKIHHLELQLVSTREELTRRLERNADRIIERIKETEDRVSQNQDRIEVRVQSLEASMRFSNKQSNKNN